jgi:hypothetical protein
MCVCVGGAHRTIMEGKSYKVNFSSLDAKFYLVSYGVPTELENTWNLLYVHKLCFHISMKQL